MSTTQWIAFAQTRCLAQGQPKVVAEAVKNFTLQQPDIPVLVFDAHTSQTLELDVRGSLEEVLARLDTPSVSEQTTRRLGRPKLGVVAREVTLLPRHWEWLATQPGGASVALRKLVEQAMRTTTQAEQVRHTQTVAYRFMQAVAGDEVGYEEALRALFAGDQERLQQCISTWPEDIREHTWRLATANPQAFANPQ